MRLPKETLYRWSGDQAVAFKERTGCFLQPGLSCYLILYTCDSDIEPEMHHIAILHQVFFTFYAQFTVFAAGGF